MALVQLSRDILTTIEHPLSVRVPDFPIDDILARKTAEGELTEEVIATIRADVIRAMQKIRMAQEMCLRAQETLQEHQTQILYTARLIEVGGIQNGVLIKNDGSTETRFFSHSLTHTAKGPGIMITYQTKPPHKLVSISFGIFDKSYQLGFSKKGDEAFCGETEWMTHSGVWTTGGNPTRNSTEAPRFTIGCKIGRTHLSGYERTNSISFLGSRAPIDEMETFGIQTDNNGIHIVHSLIDFGDSQADAKIFAYA